MIFTTLKNGLKIANVHLCGGKIDDTNKDSNLHAQTEIYDIIHTYNPDIILGDFNADSQAKRT